MGEIFTLLKNSKAMFIKSVILMILLLILLNISGCYLYHKIVHAGSFGWRSKSGNFKAFPEWFDISSDGTIYFTLMNNEDLSICSINLNDTLFYELVNTEMLQYDPVLSNNEKFLAFKTCTGSFFKKIDLYDIESKKFIDLSGDYHFELEDHFFSLDDRKIFFVDSSVNKDTLDLKNYRYPYLDIYERDLLSGEIRKISNVYFDGVKILGISQDKSSLILKPIEWFESEEKYEPTIPNIFFHTYDKAKIPILDRFNNLNIERREPYGGYLYLNLETGKITQVNIDWENPKKKKWRPWYQRIAILKNRDAILVKSMNDFTGIWQANCETGKGTYIADSIDGRKFRSFNKQIFDSFIVFNNDKDLLGLSYDGNSFIIYNLDSEKITKRVEIQKKNFVPLNKTDASE